MTATTDTSRTRSEMNGYAFAVSGTTSGAAVEPGPLVRLAIGITSLLFVLPFLNPIAWLPIPSFNAEWTAAAVLAISLLVVSLTVPVRFAVQRPLPAFLTLLAVIEVVHVLRGTVTFSFNFWVLLIYCLTALAAYLLGRALKASGHFEAVTKSAAVALIAGASTSVVIQTLQLANVSGLPYWLFFELRREVQNGYPYANLGQPNHLATYLAMAGVGTLYMNHFWRRPTAVIFLALIGAGLAMTGSRMGFAFAGLLAVAAVTTTLGLAPGSQARRLHLAAGVGIGYVLGTFAVTHLLHQEAGGMLSAAQRYIDGDYGTRLSMWQDAVTIAMSSPLIGVGAGEYAGAHYLMANPSPTLVSTPYAHNLVLQVAAEFGLAAAAALLALVVWWCWAGLRKRLMNRETAMAFGALVPLGIHSLLEYPLAYLFFVVVAAFLFALSEPESRSGGQLVRSRRVFLPIALAGLMAVVTMKLDYDTVAAVTRRFYDDRRTQAGFSLETAIGLRGIADSTFFVPQVERLIIEFLPFSAQTDDESVARNWRAMTKLADPVLIARHIVLLARTGRSEQAVPHVERLRAFSHKSYPLFRDLVVHELPANDTALGGLRNSLLRD
jgi:O-antigen ligase